MTERLFTYPLLLLAALLALTLGRQGVRWHAGALAQLAVVLLLGSAALLWPSAPLPMVLGWVLLVWFVFVPRWFLGLAWRRLMRRDLAGAARAWQTAGLLVWGQTGRLYRDYATALRQHQGGDWQLADRIMARCEQPGVPLVVRGAVQAWQLSVLVADRHWAAAVAQYERAGDWGLLATATQARLLVARAYAELGCFEQALRCLYFVALSPRTLGDLARQLLSARVSVAALAGDVAETERLLSQEQQRGRSGFGRFAATWRGRCALACGERELAQQQFTRALALTHHRENWWRAALQEYADAAAADAPKPATIPAESPGYRHGQVLLREAERTAAPWRALLEITVPSGATQGLLASLVAVWLGLTLMGSMGRQDLLLQQLANTRGALVSGQWWRPLTALWVHTEWWHLLMNGLGLWVFGGAVQRALGGARLLVLFVVGGALGNIWSGLLADYQLSIGASGGVFALLGAFAVLLYRLDIPLYDRYRRQFLWLLLVMVGIDLGIGGLEALVDNQAHIGGLVAGVGLGALLGRVQKRGQPPRPHL